MTLQAPRRIRGSRVPARVLVDDGPRKTALNSDALTGQRLDPRKPVYVVSDIATMSRRAPRYLEAEGEPVTPPVNLHKSRTDEGGLGGLEYSMMMLAYLNAALRELQREKRRIDRAELAEAMAWWRNPDGTPNEYGITRVRLALDNKMPHAIATHVLEVVLTCHREQADPSVIAQRFKRPAAWVYSKVDLCMRISGYHRTGCTCSKCVARESLSIHSHSSTTS